jgi:hypothetical protein
MSMKDFDAKQFLLQKGERVGLGVALGLMVLLIVFSLFIPPNGLFSGSPVEKAESLSKVTTDVQNQLRTNRPGDNDKPGKAELIQFVSKSLDPHDYEVETLFQPRRPDNPNRRPPTLYGIDEAHVEVAHVPIDTYLFTRNFGSVVFLKDSTNKHQGGGNLPGGPNMAAHMGKQMKGFDPRMMMNPGAMNPGGGMRGGPGGGMMGGPGGMRGMPNPMQMMNNNGHVTGTEDTETRTLEEVFIPRDKLADKQNVGGLIPAKRPMPLRMAIIAASFPYRAQLEEFKNKLRLHSLPEVLTDQVEDPKAKDGKKAPAFRFLGVNVERREVDASGKPLPGPNGQWIKLDPNASYKPWMQLSLGELQPEEPEYQAISFPGLVMPLLKEFHAEDVPGAGGTRGGMPGAGPGGPPMPGQGPMPEKERAAAPSESKYPKVVEEVKNLSKTLAALKELGSRAVAAPKTGQELDSFDVFNPHPVSEQPTGMMPPGGMPMPTGKATEGTPAQEGTFPEHCLVRIVDVTIVPGKTYEYRLQVRLANPNYQRKDVASPSYAEGVELAAKDNTWFVVPQKVTVPPELIYYVVDQALCKDLNDGKPYPIKRGFVAGSPDQVAMQIHRWIDSTTSNGKNPQTMIVGDWAVADRILVKRGEYVGRWVRTEVPVWRYKQISYVIPADSNNKKVAGTEVYFGHEGLETETILVDFEGGQQMYERVIGRTEDSPGKVERTNDNSAIEVLMLSPDGKLRARTSARDVQDEERIRHRHDLYERIDKVKEAANKAGGAGGGKENIFGNK